MEAFASRTRGKLAATNKKINKIKKSMHQKKKTLQFSFKVQEMKLKYMGQFYICFINMCTRVH